MITKNRAIHIAHLVVTEISLHFPGSLILLESYTEEHDFGWIFYYNTPEFVKTGISEIAGNAPFIITKDKGQIYITGTAGTTESYIEKFKQGILEPYVLKK